MERGQLRPDVYNYRNADKHLCLADKHADEDTAPDVHEYSDAVFYFDNNGHAHIYDYTDKNPELDKDNYADVYDNNNKDVLSDIPRADSHTDADNSPNAAI
jgi:hypothetical protein